MNDGDRILWNLRKLIKNLNSSTFDVNAKLFILHRKSVFVHKNQYEFSKSRKIADCRILFL